MPIRLMHVVDERTPEDALRQLSLLLRRLPAEHCLMIAEPFPGGLVVPSHVAVVRVGRRGTLQFGPSGASRQLMAEYRPHLLHAWGTSAARIARLARPEGLPIVLTVSDHAEIDDVALWWPLDADSMPRPAATVICASDALRRRLVGAGIPREVTTIVRPGIESDQIERARRVTRRAELGLPEAGRVLVTPSPATRAGGQFFAAWAAAILFQVWPDVRLVIPGRSREQDRIRRLIESIYCPQVYLLTEDAYTPAEMLAVSDLLVAPAIEGGSTWWPAAAMTAGVPVVASNLPSAAEFIRDDESGFLCRPGEPHTLAIRIRTAMETPGAAGRCAAAARQRATEWFDADRCVDAYAVLYSSFSGTLAGARRSG